MELMVWNSLPWERAAIVRVRASLTGGFGGFREFVINPV
jgi:hypothetical protein